MRRQRSLRQQEEELRMYEEKVFVEHIVNSVDKTSRQKFKQEY